MSILPGTAVADALGNGGPWSLVSSDGAEGSLHMNQLQAAVQGATGAAVQAGKGPGLHASFNSAGVGMERTAPAIQQPEIRPDLVAAQQQTMNFTNG